MNQIKLYHFSGHDFDFHCFAESLEQAVELSREEYQRWFDEVLGVDEFDIPSAPQLVVPNHSSSRMDDFVALKEKQSD